MTIAKYEKDLQEMAKHFKASDGRDLVQFNKECVHIWSNYACRGYCKRACMDAGLDEEQLEAVMDALWRAFDDMTIEEAEQNR